MYSSWLGCRPRRALLAFVLLLVLADQGSKAWFVATIPLGTGTELTGWLNLDLHWHALHWPAFNLTGVFVLSAVLAWALLPLQAARRCTADATTPKGAA